MCSTPGVELLSDGQVRSVRSGYHSLGGPPEGGDQTKSSSAPASAPEHPSLGAVAVQISTAAYRMALLTILSILLVSLASQVVLWSNAECRASASWASLAWPHRPTSTGPYEPYHDLVGLLVRIRGCLHLSLEALGWVPLDARPALWDLENK